MSSDVFDGESGMTVPESLLENSLSGQVMIRRSYRPLLLNKG